MFDGGEGRRHREVLYLRVKTVGKDCTSLEYVQRQNESDNAKAPLSILYQKRPFFSAYPICAKCIKQTCTNNANLNARSKDSNAMHTSMTERETERLQTQDEMRRRYARKIERDRESNDTIDSSAMPQDR